MKNEKDNMALAQNSQNVNPWTQDDLVRHLRESCGISGGDKVMVHSSMKAIGFVAGGPCTVINAFQEVITPSGLLVMPALSHITPDGRFDQATTPSRVGLLTETFRTTSGVLRSLHPTHSVCAWGYGAEQLLAGHENTTPAGPGSPFHKFAQADGILMMVGCTMTACTMIHTAESLAKVPYLGQKTFSGYERTHFTLVDRNGREFPHTLSHMPGCSRHFSVAQEVMESQNQIHHCLLGQAATICFSAKAALQTALDLLTENPGALLCQAPSCSVCPLCRNFLPRGELMTPLGK